MKWKNKAAPIVIVLISCAALIGCAVYSQNTFSQWSGPNQFQGTGGSKKILEGIDVWTTGLPDQPFQILGTISQSSVQDGSLVSTLATLDSEASLARDAKKQGGDGIIFITSDTKLIGYNASINAGSYYGGSYGGAPLVRLDAQTATSKRVAVVKYIR